MRLQRTFGIKSDPVLCEARASRYARRRGHRILDDQIQSADSPHVTSLSPSTTNTGQRHVHRSGRECHPPSTLSVPAWGFWINEPSKVFVARGGIAELTTTILTADEVRDLVERMLRSSGRRVDLSSPFVDATLQDGSRLHVVIPDITKDHWHVNIRKFVVKADHLDDLVRLGTVTRQAAKFLEACVVAGLNILVAGGTQAGKTTFLN